MEAGAALTDGAEGHVDGFFDEVPFVGGGGCDEAEDFAVGRLGITLIVRGEGPEEGEGGAFLEFVLALAPLPHFGSGVRGAVEEVETEGVGDGPVIKVAAATVHLRGGDALGFVDISAEHAGFVDAGAPKPGGEGVVGAEEFGELAEIAHGDAEGVVGRNGVAGHASAGDWAAVRF